MPPRLAPKAKAAALAKAKARAAAAQAANRAAKAAAKAAAAVAAKAGAAAGVAGAGAAAYVPPPWVAGLLAGLGGGAAGPLMLPVKAPAPGPPAAFAEAGPPAPPHGMMRPPMPGPGMMMPGWGGGFGHLMAQNLGGGMAPPYGQFMGMQPIPAPPAPGGPATPWIQFAVDPGQISQMATPGAFLEIVNLDPQTQQADGSTSLVQITIVHPPDAAGAYCELEFLGSSWPARSQALMMACQGGAVLHLCAGVCQITPGGRLVLHVTVAQLRQP